MMKRIRAIEIFLILSGLLSVIFSLRSVVRWMQVKYFWSFITVKPDINSDGLLDVSYSIPEVVHTYEVLLPWMILGMALMFTGILLEIVPKRGKKLSMKINNVSEISE
jgi:hypothetical protein